MPPIFPKPFQALTPEEKRNKSALLDMLCMRVWNEKLKEGGKLKNGFISDLIRSNTSLIPSLTRDCLNNALRKYAKLEITSCATFAAHYPEKMPHAVTPPSQSVQEVSPTQSQPSSSPTPCTPAPTPPIPVTPSPTKPETSKGGRPKGTTVASKLNLEKAVVSTLNEIADIYDKERKEQKKKKMKKGRLQEIIKEVREQNNIPEDITINVATIQQRCRRKRTQVYCSGPPPPLGPIEDRLIATMLLLCRIRQPVTPSQAISLANSMIKDTPVQQQLIEFKRKSKSQQDPKLWGTVGQKFWYNLKRRYYTVIDSKKGQKFELDRSSWTTYHNFDQMYVEVAKEMIEAGVAKIFPTPVWMDRDGNIVEEENSYGCMVTHDIVRPECCFALDEVGGNTSQKGDGQVGGEKLVCGKNEAPQKSINVKSKHYTVMGITAFTGEVVMCVIIFAGLKPKVLYETGYDPHAEMFGDWLDEDFMEKNTGDGKMFPCGPTCSFRGKEVPTFCAWSENGSVTSEILADILRRLDEYEVCDRTNGVKPFLLLDGHGSRFELPFLDYIIDPAHEWVVCIGVPYGTALWQIADSSEQNGTFNIGSAKAKRKIVQENQTHSVPPYIYPHDIIRIVKPAWKDSFANTSNNRKAISERGWYPYNRNLMMNPGLRSTMTKDEKENEKNGNSSVHLPSHFTRIITDLTKPLCNPQFSTKKHQPEEQLCNFSSGTAAWALEEIVKKDDIMAARERIKNNVEVGLTLKERLEKCKKVTAGVLVGMGRHRLDTDVHSEIHSRKRKRIEKAAKAKQKATEARNSMLEKAREVWAVQQDVTKMTNKQLIAILRPLRKKDEPAIP